MVLNHVLNIVQSHMIAFSTLTGNRFFLYTRIRTKHTSYIFVLRTYILYSLPSYLYKFMHHIVIDNIREVYIRRNSFSASPKLKVKK